MIADRSANRGVFGYLPGHADFVRVRASGREVRRLEDWLERGLHQAQWEMGGGFAVAYPRLFHRFAFRPDNADQTVLGVVCASLDSHQRPFPFVAFELIPTAQWDRDPVAIVCENGVFFEALEGLVREVGALSHIGQIHGRVLSSYTPLVVSAAAAPDPSAHAAAAARYENFLQETCCADLGCAGRADGLLLFHDLYALLGTGQDPRLFRQALALALRRPLFARDLELRFYLSACLKLVARAIPTTTLFWQCGGAASGSLFLSFREPTFDLFAALLGQDGGSSVGSRRVFLPGAGSATAPAVRPLPELTPTTSLHTLLGMLAAETTEAGLRRKGAR